MKKIQKKKPHQDKQQSRENSSDEMIEVQIEKNLFIKTRDHDRKRLEKWQVGKRNFS